jgi:hypothetical protein
MENDEPRIDGCRPRRVSVAVLPAGLLAAAIAAASLAGCTTAPPVAKAYGEALTYCAEDEVLACDHVSRVRNVARLCTCQPGRQMLNMEMNR